MGNDLIPTDDMGRYLPMTSVARDPYVPTTVGQMLYKHPYTALAETRPDAAERLMSRDLDLRQKALDVVREVEELWCVRQAYSSLAQVATAWMHNRNGEHYFEAELDDSEFVDYGWLWGERRVRRRSQRLRVRTY